MPQAIAFDLDGTLIDTESLHAESQRRTLEAFGIHGLPPGHPRTFGMGLEPGVTRLSEFYDLDYQEAMDVYLPLWEHLAATELTPMPGARDLVQWFHTQKVPLALVTSADTGHAENSVAALDVPGAFECIVLREMVSAMKPSPEPYLTAAECLGVTPENMVAFKDSGAGVTSVLAAGMFCVGVHRDVQERPEMTAAQVKIRSLDEYCMRSSR
jgi:HAD superfamily hydrolase (TIGR01509 family)